MAAVWQTDRTVASTIRRFSLRFFARDFSNVKASLGITFFQENIATYKRQKKKVVFAVVYYWRTPRPRVPPNELPKLRC
jgi:hypothetical protein